MKNIKILFWVFVVGLFILTGAISYIYQFRKSGTSSQDFVVGRIASVNTRDDLTVQGGKEDVYQVAVWGKSELALVAIPRFEGYTSTFQKESNVLLTTNLNPEGKRVYFIVDHFRIPALIFALLCFVVLVLVITKRKGIASLLGLFYGVFFIFFAFIPLIIAGYNPFVVSIIGIGISAILSLYMSHGLRRHTTIAVISTVLLLLFAALTAYLFALLANITGYGSEESVSLAFNPRLKGIDLRGLFLAGVMISVLGVLDDITTAQAAIVEELKRANNSLDMKQLYTRAFSVGREHIISLVNTLAYAYIGSSLIMFLVLSVSENQSVLALLNSEFIAQEVVQTVVGSAALVLAVPLTTLIGAWHYSRISLSDNEVGERHPHSHVHHHIH
jgi:uncharacterized membrane protein